jgi:hypothetical protein
VPPLDATQAPPPLATIEDVTDLPPDPDLDDLPDELCEREGPFTVSGVDHETGERFDAQLTRDELASAFADARRYDEDDHAAWTFVRLMMQSQAPGVGAIPNRAQRLIQSRT